MTILTRAIARILFLPLLIVAFAVLVKGYADIGDGFSAGVIASLAFILQGVVFGAQEFVRLPLARFAPIGAFLGLALALAVAFGPVVFDEEILRHHPEAGEEAVHFGSLEFITPVLFDVGVFLIVVGFCVGCLGSIGREAVRREREHLAQGDARGAGERRGTAGGTS
jgi:multisubunit Na+/H+ antiporter MnhB subunit